MAKKREQPRTQQADAPPLKVFVSSTYLDNVQRRRLVQDVIIQAGMIPHAMEFWPAQEREPQDLSLDYVREADLFVGILGWRFGWTPDGGTKSITEMEYDEAGEVGVERLMFEIERGAVDPDKDFDDGPDKYDKQKLLEAFKRRVQRDVHPQWFNAETLTGRVATALHNHLAKLRGGEAAEPEPQRPTPAFDQQLAVFLDQLARRHDALSLAGFSKRVRVEMRLQDLYVPMRVMLNTRLEDDEFGSGREADEKLRHSDRHDDLNLVQALELLKVTATTDDRRHRGIVVLGDPGSGKTTHLRRVVFSMVRGEERLHLPADMVPVFLPLRALKAEDTTLRKFFLRFLTEEDDDNDPDIAEGFAKSLWKRGNLLLLVDGLDEVPEERRAEIRKWIEDAARKRDDLVCVVTCRYAGYKQKARLGGGFLELHLRPLTNESAERFIHNWYRVVETTFAQDVSAARKRAVQRAEDLVERLRLPDFRASRVYEMIRNPLLLTAVCLVHRDRGRDLPDRRADLYLECVRVLLELWRDAAGLAVTFPEKEARPVLRRIALSMQEQKLARAPARVLREIVETAFRDTGSATVDGDTFLCAIRDESGLLTGWSGDEYGFMHLGFQEFLAAEEIRERALAAAVARDDAAYEAVLRELAAHFDDSWWHEVILLVLSIDGQSLFAPLLREVVAGQAWLGQDEFVDQCLGDAFEFDPAPFVELLEDETVDAERRRAAARALRSHDPERFEQIVVERWIESEIRSAGTVGSPALRATTLSPRGGIELVAIAGGTFTMGSPETERQRDDDEDPHRVVVPEFQLASFAVTNEQYGRYLAENPDAEEPEYWADKRFNQPNQPVVGVSWDEARAFCAWAGLRLPSEAEWEYACRAGTTTPFWFGETITTRQVNFDGRFPYAGGEKGGYRQRTVPVGSLPPNGYGLYEMHGNVWEWCEDTWHKSYDGAPCDGSAWVNVGAAYRVMRGGGWFEAAGGCRSACRGKNQSGFRGYSTGFRPARS